MRLGKAILCCPELYLCEGSPISASTSSVACTPAYTLLGASPFLMVSYAPRKITGLGSRISHQFLFKPLITSAKYPSTGQNTDFLPGGGGVIWPTSLLSSHLWESTIMIALLDNNSLVAISQTSQEALSSTYILRA